MSKLVQVLINKLPVLLRDEIVGILASWIDTCSVRGRFEDYDLSHCELGQSYKLSCCEIALLTLELD